MASSTTKAGKEVVRIEFDKGVAWVTLNRPEKRNAMNPALNARMLEVLDELEADDRCGVLILTGEGEAFSAGMDLKEYFREMEGKPRIVTQKARRAAYEWQWRRLRYFEKPTIAMVNGWCFGGAFTPLVSCDLAIAAEEAQFGLSEINWGIIPAGNVTRAVAETMRHRDALYYIMTGLTFDGRKAAEMGLVNEAVPRAAVASACPRTGRPSFAEESRRGEGGQRCLQENARSTLGNFRGLPDFQAGTTLADRGASAPRGPETIPG